MKLYNRSISQDSFDDEGNGDAFQAAFKERLHSVRQADLSTIEESAEEEQTITFQPSPLHQKLESQSVPKGPAEALVTDNPGPSVAVDTNPPFVAAPDPPDDLTKIEALKMPLIRTDPRSPGRRLSRRSPRSSPSASPVRVPHASGGGSEAGPSEKTNPSHNPSALRAIPAHVDVSSPDVSSADEDPSDLPPSRRRHLASRSRRTPKAPL